MAVVCHPGIFSVTVLLSSESMGRFSAFFPVSGGEQAGEKIQFFAFKIIQNLEIDKTVFLGSPGGFSWKSLVFLWPEIEKTLEMTSSSWKLNSRITCSQPQYIVVWKKVTKNPLRGIENYWQK